MNKTNNSKLTGNAKTLRKNMTKEERHLWYDFLKTLPLTVNRQKVIGNYIVDFYIASSKIVIELDGSQHYKDCRNLTNYKSPPCVKEGGTRSVTGGLSK